MRNLFTNLVLFFALSIAFSGFTACSNTATTQKDSVDESAPPLSAESKKSDYPPAPVGIMQEEIKDLDGNTFKFEDKKGKVVLINLWAIWCGPCIGEMPHLIEMQEKYRDKGFEVVGLNVGDQDGQVEPVDNIKAFAAKMNLNYQLGYADNKFVSDFFKISRRDGIPQSLIINREGELTGVFTGGGRGVINKMKESVDKTINE
ncbi:MAG: TlpA family protein disulfide reductase [Acidobacteria bacterium]|nr:TlpA family protein disulfide reductase [Acidobacteriota bacterium]MCA1637123.1 TlpA family protein disulfide reductase [Acidobacteriota bacterium]